MFTVFFLYMYHPTHHVHCILLVPPNTSCSLYPSCTTQHIMFTVFFLHVPPNTCIMFIVSSLYHPTHYVYSILISCTTPHTVFTIYIFPVPPETSHLLHYSSINHHKMIHSGIKKIVQDGIPYRHVYI